MGHANAGELTIAASIGELHALLAAPAWRGHSHVAMERSHLLRVSDEPVMRKLNWLRTK